jgi:hypothetical protein
MDSKTKRTGMLVSILFAGLVLLVPVCLMLWMSLSFRTYRIAQGHEAARLVAEFHQRFNAHDLDAICRDAYKCSDFPNLRQDWQRLLDDTRNRGGTFRGLVRSDIDVSIEPFSVRADVLSSFEKGEVREIFIMKDYDGPLRIVSYQVVTKEGPASQY